MWQWYPALRLEEGKSYTLHLSSADLNHGFSLQPFNLNFQVVPGYDYGLRVTPQAAGDFRVICNEYCGIGHHLMIGKIEVVTAARRRRRATGAGQGSREQPMSADRAVRHCSAAAR